MFFTQVLQQVFRVECSPVNSAFQFRCICNFVAWDNLNIIAIYICAQIRVLGIRLKPFVTLQNALPDAKPLSNKPFPGKMLWKQNKNINVPVAFKVCISRKRARQNYINVLRSEE